ERRSRCSRVHRQGRQPLVSRCATPSPCWSETEIMSQARPTILIADDDPLTRLFVKNALEPAGMVVVEATGGKDALTKFEAEPSDLVILDIMMPEVDGYLTCSRIRSLPRGKRIPILILTGLDDVNS